MEAKDLLESLTAGLVCGFVVAVPIGPVNLTVIKQALRRGFLPAFLVGLGAMSAETIYATVLLAGHTSLLDKPAVRNPMRVLAVLVILAVGLRSLLLKEEKLEATEAKADKLDERWHHPRAFLLGFLLTIFNLGLVVLWTALTAMLFDRDWVNSTLASRSACSTGVFVGGAVWFFLLTFFVSRAHRRVKPKTLTTLVHISGMVLIVFAGLLAIKLFKF